MLISRYLKSPIVHIFWFFTVKTREKDKMIASKQIDKAERVVADRSHAGADGVKDSHIQAGRVVPTGSPRRRLAEQ